MLMFQNGLLATFIPELILVLGYIFCLFGSNSNVVHTVSENGQQIVQISTIEKASVPTYTVCNCDFPYTQLYVNSEQQPFNNLVVEKVNYALVLPFKIINGLSFVQFSRPPPLFLG